MPKKNEESATADGLDKWDVSGWVSQGENNLTEGGNNRTIDEWGKKQVPIIWGGGESEPQRFYEAFLETIGEWT